MYIYCKIYDVLRLLSLLLSVLCFLSCSEKVQHDDLSLGYDLYDSGVLYLKENLTDSAFHMFDEARNIFIEGYDSLNTANVLIHMAMIQRDQGDYFGAQETSLQALEYLDEYDPAHRIYVSSTYNNLAIASSFLGNYEQAIDFYEHSYRFSDSSANTYLIRNNLAISYRRKGNYAKAFEIFQGIILETEKSNPREYARVLSNYAMAKLQKDSTYDAAPELLDALYIRMRENDLSGLNASYSHLTDYYAQNKRDSAIFYANKQYEVANRIKNPDSRLRALDRLITLSPTDSSKRYYTQYKQISDSLHQARAAAKNQFAVIRYEVEKNKADNLRLQKDNALKANRLTQQYTITGSISLLFILAVSGGSFYYKKRRQRLELEAQDRIKASQLKTSRKVHDVVANGIYRVMSDIEYKDAIDREDLLDKLEDMYHKSRDISYDTEEALEYDQSFHEHMTGLIKSFASDCRTVFIVGNEPDIWHSFDHDAREHIRHVLQELMVNMDKHSQAENVVVRFETSPDAIRIYYSDDGVGLQKDTPYGNGLANTVSRIESLQGKITFVLAVDKGLKIEIMIPSL